MNHRNNDPPTSHLAGRYIESSGLAGAHRRQCMETLVATPGLTAQEVEARTGIKAHKRLPELRSQNLVANGLERVCSVSGRRAMTWYPLCENVPTQENTKNVTA